MTKEAEIDSRIGAHVRAGKQLSTAVFFMLLQGIESEALACANFRLGREGMFRGVLRATFVKAFEFARYCNRMERDEEGEEAFFLASSLRATCEELIAQKFLRRLRRQERDDVVRIELARSVQKAIEAQAEFFPEGAPVTARLN
jgi:hypothetical protein